MTDSNVVYSTGLHGQENTFERQEREQREKELAKEMEFLFSEPWHGEELDDQEEMALWEDYQDQQHLDYEDDEGFDLTEEELQHYDDNCEEYEENKRKQMQLEQER